MSGLLGSIYNNVSYSLGIHSEAMLRLQEQASTGSRINRASDDPSAAYRILGLNSQLRLTESYMDNIAQASGMLNFSSIAFFGDGNGSGMIDIISSIKSNMTQILSDTYTEDQRKTEAERINGYLEEMLVYANTKYVDSYVFGGSDTNSAPYEAVRTNGEITSVTYVGSSENRDVEVAAGVESSGSYIGDDIFRVDNRGTPIFLGDTGAAVGTGTASVRGDAWLTVTGGPGSWLLSIEDGGANPVAANGTETNLALTDSDGRVLYVDTTGITSTGVDMVRVPGTHDIFSVLIGIRDVLKNERVLPDAQISELRDNAVNSLSEVENLLVDKSVAIGSRIGFLESLRNMLEDTSFNIKSETALLGDADITQVAIDLSQREVLYEMSLSIAARLLSTSLMDFIR